MRRSYFVNNSLENALNTMEPVSYTETIAVTKDVILALAACVGVYVALRGLSAWNRQLKGGVEYDLARKILRNTFRLREAISMVRNPVLTIGEQPSPPEDEARSMNRDEISYYGESRAYQKRWDGITEVRAELNTDLLDVEVLWGREIRELFEPLFRLQRELYLDVFTYLRSIDPAASDESRESRSHRRRGRREVIYDISDENPDDYAREISESIAPIESYLRKQHL